VGGIGGVLPDATLDIYATFSDTSPERGERETHMSLVREIFQAKTGISGNYWTVVYEREVRSIDPIGVETRKIPKDEKLRAMFKDHHTLVESGHREIYKVEQ